MTVQRHPDYMLLAVAVLEGSGHGVRFIDGQVGDKDRSHVESLLSETCRDMLFVHTTRHSIYDDSRYSTLAKPICQECMTVGVRDHVEAGRDGMRHYEAHVVLPSI